MKTITNFLKYGIIASAALCFALNANVYAADKATWGNFKLWIDPGHSGNENGGLYNYSEAYKVLRVGLATREFIETYTTAVDSTNIMMTRYNDVDEVSLEERSDMANAWGADFFYAIHSDAGDSNNSTLFLFGGWNKDGVSIEKTPNGGKRFGSILDPNLTGVMYKTTSRGNWYDRCYYMPNIATHEYQYPYLSVNRRTNMASLLSEGGFHTIPMQQALNINDSYKRLEAFGTFRSILEYVGVTRPDKVMLTGVVTNSENDQPLDGVTVAVAGDTVITDSYASLFNKYTKNANLIHNGYFLFEGLTPGKEYTVTYSAPGFTSATQTVTLKTDPQGLSGNNVTWANVALTSSSPAVVSSVNVDDPSAVSTLDDIVFTFSRKMDEASVEKAFSINNGGACTLSWDNDYTLRVNISKLMNDMDYTVTIDGAVAKNSQTNQFLDGNADGTAGGNYTFSFTTVPPDVEAPYVKSTTPIADSTMLYTLRPVIRIEYNEKLNWNEDEAVDAVVVEDKDGNKIPGTLKHAVINGASVLHYFFNSDLTIDKCYKVTVKAGFKDMSGNLSKGKVFRFLTDFHPVTSSTVIANTNNVGEWFSPAGSGSSEGWTSTETNTMVTSDTTSSADIATSYHVHFDFDPTSSGALWQLRCYYRNGVYYADGAGAIIQAYVYGDGSNNSVGHCVRDRADASVKRQQLIPMNFRGWNIIATDVNNETYVNVSGTSPKVPGKWEYDAFFIKHENTDDLDPNDSTPRQSWIGDVMFDDLKYVHYGAATQTASINDIPLTGVDDILAADITVNVSKGQISVIAPDAIKSVAVYAMNGTLVAAVAPSSTRASLNVANLTTGAYVVNVVTLNKNLAKRVIIR
jgi:N-acetylmuramoyl-L-alanine amidase